MTTRMVFDDGSEMELLHRYALRYRQADRTMDIGFELALEPNVDRLIHAETISRWNDPHKNEIADEAERRKILSRVEEYCRAKKFPFRTLSLPEGPDSAT